MKLINNLFTILETSVFESDLITTIEINPDHIIYSGHFPGHPVTPGVIQMQIIHELLEKHIGKNLKLKTMSDCKFLRVLNPKEISQIVIHIRFNVADELLHIKAQGENGRDVFFKIDSNYQFI